MFPYSSPAQSLEAHSSLTVPVPAFSKMSNKWTQNLRMFFLQCLRDAYVFVTRGSGLSFFIAEFIHALGSL